MNAVHNVRLLGGGADTKKSSMSSFALKFDMHKVDDLTLWILIWGSLEFSLYTCCLFCRKNVQPEKKERVNKKHGNCHGFTQ